MRILMVHNKIVYISTDVSSCHIANQSLPARSRKTTIPLHMV